MKFSLFAAAATIAGFSYFGQGATNPVLKAHADALKTAKSFTATFTVAKLPAAPVAYTLTYSKPGSFRIESPDTLVVCDGKKLTELNKLENTYSEADASTMRASMADVFAWAAFFDPEAFKEVQSVVPGAKRSIKGNPVTELVLTLSPTKTVTLFIDNRAGVARGASVRINNGRETIETLTLASEMAIGAEALPDSTFTFVPPAGAKKADKPKIEATFSGVSAIFRANCTKCHNPRSSKAGLDLTTYATAMAGGSMGPVIIAGDPANSKLLGTVNGTMSPRMPRDAPPLSETEVKTISDWIAAGAKEK